MNIVIDSNIIFSAILNSSSKIGQVLTLGGKFFNFYSVDLLKVEIERHKKKLTKLSKLSAEQVETNIEILCSRIKFVDSIVLSNEQIEDATELTKGIDINDTLFVAMAQHLNGKLWTGDIKLAKGLAERGNDLVISTSDIYEIYKKSMQ